MLTVGHDSNVLAIDYRGFADSSGIPSEAGLIEDAKTAWDYVVDRIGIHDGAEGKNIVLMGQSLGTGVAAGLAGRLAHEGV
jgi:abhydrolase domain-containing protein 12